MVRGFRIRIHPFWILTTGYCFQTLEDFYFPYLFLICGKKY
jgi:hypothetical protein